MIEKRYCVHNNSLCELNTYKNDVAETLQNHYNELTRQLEERIDCLCSAQSRARIIAIMEELGVELK